MASEPIAETPVAANHISADVARGSATDFLLDNVGNLLSAGEPHLMVSAVRAMWIVPVGLGYLHTGVLGTVGVVAVDEETGQVIAWTPVAVMKAAAHRLRELHEPELTTKFRSLIALDTSATGK